MKGLKYKTIGEQYINQLYQFKTNYYKMVVNITNQLADYIDQYNIKSLVLGLSGGIDSTLTAALAREAVSIATTDTKIIGYALDIYSKKNEIERGANTGDAFCDESGIKILNNTFDIVAEDIIDQRLDLNDTDVKIRLGNIKARLRMIKLFDLARANNGIVLSTDNLTELLLGFWTLHGDVGNYGMMQNLWKTEVYGIAKYMAKEYINTDHLKAEALNAAITAVPTDGLGITNSDFDQIIKEVDQSNPAKAYQIIDESLMDYIYNDAMKAEAALDNFPEVIDRYRRTNFKREDPYNIPRELVVG